MYPPPPPPAAVPMEVPVDSSFHIKCGNATVFRDAACAVAFFRTAKYGVSICVGEYQQNIELNVDYCKCRFFSPNFIMLVNVSSWPSSSADLSSPEPLGCYWLLQRSNQFLNSCRPWRICSVLSKCLSSIFFCTVFLHNVFGIAPPPAGF